jgi:hypothetical protein
MKMIQPAARLLRLSLLACTAAAAAHAGAENRMPIDDFSSGHFQAKSIKSGSESSTQAGTMLGGQRSTTLTLCSSGCKAANPWRQGVSYGYVADAAQAGSNAFVQSASFDTAPRIDQGYGPMNADLSAFNRVRVNFAGLSESLNFNILMFTGAGRGQNGCNLVQHNGPFSVEFPYAGFVPANGGFVPGDVTDISLVYQSADTIGSVEFAITSIEVSDTPMPGATTCSLVAG